ncbi:MAG: penicillin-binding protein 2 [Verrucomicrobiae bacterium]|nr:penicillin-binding protein 2 [Verrucomicrobiae bacterium]
MAKRLQFRRLLLLVFLLAAAFAGLGYRLVDLQVLRHEELRDRARKNTQREMLREPRRGDILDARGNQLATSVLVKTVCADPTVMSNYQAVVARALSPLLEMPEGELYQRMLPRYRTNDQGQVSPYLSNVLKRKVTVETWEKVQLAMSQLDFGVEEKALSKAQQKFFRDLRRAAIFTERVDDQLRVYPNQHLAAHVLGYVGMDGRTNSPTFSQTIGMDGIEHTLNGKLAGVRGWRVTETDSRRREVVSFRDQDVEPRDGFNVVLTIDSVIQSFLETALAEGMEKHAPVSASGIVVRPRTGEILALATLPNFDPNNPGADAEARRNRVITDIMEPGSTFKIVVVSGGLNDRVVRLTDMFDCEHGHFAFGGRILHDHGSYGVLSVENIITKSSNIGAAKIGIKLGNQRLHDYVCNFGFGSRTGIPLPGEVRGLVHPVKNWSKVSIAQIPMGHGVSVTRLQMAMAMAAIANDGWLMQPMLVRRLEDREGNVVAAYAPQRVRQVISEAAARQTVQALKTAVSPEGTAPKAELEHYTVAGKTGTAQKTVDGIRGYAPGKYISSFIGFFPADNPELCISIVLDEPKQGYYGGQTAAPLFKQVAERSASYLNLKPDRGPAPATAPEALAAGITDGRTVKSVSARSANLQPTP